MFPIVSGVAQNQAGASLSVAITQNSGGVILPQINNPNNPNEIDCSVVASGGSGGYTYAWSIILTDDAAGAITIANMGTTNQSTYTDGQVTGGTISGPPQGAITIRCVTVDGAGASVTVETNPIVVELLY